MASKGYPHPNDETTNYPHPQPPPAYEQSFAPPSSRSGNNFYQPVITQQPIQGIFMVFFYFKIKITYNI